MITHQVVRIGPVQNHISAKGNSSEDIRIKQLYKAQKNPMSSSAGKYYISAWIDSA